jgi:hypothetical protein
MVSAGSQFDDRAMLMSPTGDEDSLVESEHEVIYRPAPQELWAEYRSHEVLSHSKPESSTPRKRGRRAKRPNEEERDPSLRRHSKRHTQFEVGGDPQATSTGDQDNHGESSYPTPGSEHSGGWRVVTPGDAPEDLLRIVM